MMTYQASESVCQTIPANVPARHDTGHVTTLSRFERPDTFLAMGGEKIRICSADFSHVRRYREFCLVEAVVHVVFQVQPSFQPYKASVLTQVPLVSASASGSYRKKLIRKAINFSLMTRAREVEEMELIA